MEKLTNKTVLITGAGIGIGRETAFEFARHGSRLILTYYKDRSETKNAVKRCLSLGAKSATAARLDLMNDASIKNLAGLVRKKFKKINILINNAAVVSVDKRGMGINKPLVKLDFPEIEKLVRTNLEGTIKLTKEFLPYIKDAIINLGSRAGKIGRAGVVTYAATKFGVRGFTQALAKEYPKLYIVAVNPDPTSTRMMGFHGRPPAVVAKAIFLAATGKYKVKSSGDIDWPMFPKK